MTRPPPPEAVSVETEPRDVHRAAARVAELVLCDPPGTDAQEVRRSGAIHAVKSKADFANGAP
jgi:hypothetical protein